MYDDFSKIHLYFSERFKLFCMRFKKQVTGDFLEPSLQQLLGYKFIASHYEFTDTLKTVERKPTLYSLTDRYFRYCQYRRDKFFDSKVWPFIISVAASVVTSVIVAYITAHITVLSAVQ